MTTTILGIPGSLRRDSFNRALLTTAATLLPEGVRLEVAELHDIPLYDFDVEQSIGFPTEVQRLRERVAAADALLIATPEYNWSIPGVLKNAIDWISRAPESPLDGILAAMISAAGGSGGSRAQAHLRDVLMHNHVRLLPQVLQVARARHHIIDGVLATPEHLDGLRNVLDALLAEVGVARSGRY